MANENEFEGKRAVVTGGTKGIGEAAVARLARAGARVVAAARNVPAAAAHANVMMVRADLSTAEGCERLVHETLARLGGVDIIVNVAGGASAPSGGFAVLSDEEWRKALDINLLSAVRLDRGLLPHMLKQ